MPLERKSAIRHPPYRDRQTGSAVMKSLDLPFEGGDALIIVPPFASLDRPSIGAHILQSCAGAQGLNVEIFYANLLLASEIGRGNYDAICYDRKGIMMGERFFASAAYDLPVLGRVHLGDLPTDSGQERPDEPQINESDLRDMEKKAIPWSEFVSRSVVEKDFKVIGCTTSFEQTGASIALLKRIKALRPEVITVLGGANCEGEMAEGILTLSSAVDYVFSGEGDISFPRFLKDLQRGLLPRDKIIIGEPCRDLDRLPTTDFNSFYGQVRSMPPERSVTAESYLWLPYETSRGCWWGQKHQCTFCGLNGGMIKFREKSPERVIADLKKLLRSHPNKNISMVDNIMPYSYFRTLLPRLEAEIPGAHIFYEQKANLSLDDVVALKRSGIGLIQPGMESISPHCLKLMNKGVTARQNIALLRYARSVNLAVDWNLLYGIPGDRIEDYQEMMALFPLMRHLHPPTGLYKVCIQRFSPYFDHPERYGIRNLRPAAIYSSILPEGANISKVAYHFLADYSSRSLEHPDLIDDMNGLIRAWRSSWQSEGLLPVLAVMESEGDQYILLDTRGLSGSQNFSFISHEEASLILSGPTDESKDYIPWALERAALVEIDSKYIPLATALPSLIREFEARSRAARSLEV